MPDDLDWRRVEIVDGVLVVSPQPSRPRAWVVAALIELLREVLPNDMVSTNTLPVGIGRTYRVPDLMVVRRTVFGEDGDALAPSDIVLAVEVESPSSVTTDRITKPAEYSRAGIAHYWRIELDPFGLQVYRPAGDVYERAGCWSGGEIAGITDPFAVEIDLRPLLP